MSRAHRRSNIVLLALACSVIGATAAGMAAAPGELFAPQSRAVHNGRDLFNGHCASCHGTTGAGNGPVAAWMRKAPPDITGLSLANGGMYPAERLRRIIDGRDVESHGDREMPVWGDVFKTQEGGASKEVIRERIGAILEYLRTIQRRQA